MWPIMLKNKNRYGIYLILVALLLVAWASVGSSAAPLTRAVSIPDQPDAAPFHLEAAFVGNVLIGTVTVSDKAGRPLTDVRGQAELLDSTGRQLSTVSLQPLSPGEFRLIVPLNQLAAPGYLDVQLPGRDKAGKQRGVYEINPASRTVAWTEAVPRALSPLSGQATGGPDAFGYTWNNAASYSWVDMSGGTSVSLRDDDWVGPFPLGFTFHFYGQAYTQFYIDSNGYIGFDSTQVASYYANGRLPSAHRPNSIVAPFWQDFDPSQGGTIRYQTFGSAGSRYSVVEWNGIKLYGTSDAQSFQVILYEGTDHVRFQYPATRQGAGGDTRYATVGIENADGTIGLEYPYTIPNTQALALEWSYSRPANNVFLTPALQGSSVAAGGAAAFHLQVRNLGLNTDSFALSRAAYAGSSWTVSFYRSDGVTPLAANTTDALSSDTQQDIVVQVSAPAGASVGSWTRAIVQATSQGNGSVYAQALVDAMFTPSFYQVYTDDYSGDGTEDLENYVDPIVGGAHYSRRLTTDLDNSNYAGAANTPDGNAVTVWNTTYWNNQAWVSDIQYAVVNAGGSLVRSIARLTDNSAATLKTYDFAPAVAVAPSGNILIDWAKQVDSNGDGALDRYDAWYTIVSSSGATVLSPTALTNNTSDFPRDYPPSAVALTGTNYFLLTWEHAAALGGPVDIYYAVLSSSGGVVKAATRLTDGTGFNVTPRAAALPNGKAAIVWTFYNGFGNGEIYYSVLNADGSSPSAPTSITANGSSASSSYAVAEALSNGQLAVAWTRQISGSLQSQVQYTIVGATPVSGISGRVTLNGSGVSGLTLNLMKYDGTSASRNLTTTTQTDGSYAFTGAGSLSAGQYYYVRYLNGPSGGNTSDSRYVAYWMGRIITSTEGTNVPGVNFDIANVTLQSPANASSLPLPVTFQWTPRGVAGDYYRWAVMNSTTFYDLCWGPYQTTGSFALDSTGFSNCGLSYSTQYGWYVYVLAGNSWSYGYGASYNYRTITFSQSGQAPQAGFTSSSPDTLGETTTFTNTTTGTEPITYLWSFGDGATSTTKNPTHAYAAAGTYTVWLTATNSYGTNATSGAVQITSLSSGIYGQVKYNGSAVAGIYLVLRFYDGSTWSTWGSPVATDGSGNYLFTGVPSLGSGQEYHVLYANNANGNSLNTNYLGWWQSFDITSYSAGSSLAGGDFDVADVTLVSPAGGSTVTLPQTFTWNPRSATATDSYEFDLFDPADHNPWAYSNLLGYVGSFGLSSLPTGFSYSTQYCWDVWVYAGNTYTNGGGESLYCRYITFSATAQRMGGTEVGQQLNQFETEDRVHHFSSSGPVLEGETSQDQLPYTLQHQGWVTERPVPELGTQHALIDASAPSPALPQTIYTVTNALNAYNIYVSLAVDNSDRLIMTWLDNANANYLYYALADKNGNLLTPATILQRTRHSYLWSSWNGYGNAYMPPQTAQGPVKIYLPVVIKNYPPPPPPQPVKNGDFEETPSLNHWTPVGSGQLAPAVVSAPVYSGTHAAVLGYQNAPCRSEPHGDSSLSQNIQVPSSGSPRLSLFYRIMTYDRLVSDKYDWFAIYINGALVLQTGRVSSTPITGCAPSPYDTGWQQFTYDLSAYQGQTIEIRLVNHTSDEWYNTWTYVDAVTVN